MLDFCAGDEAAFDALFGRWGAPLLRYLERVVRDAAVAEELVQDAFLRVYGARERYRADARFSTWLYRIATNLALNELRRPRRRHYHASTDTGEPGAPELASKAPGVERIVDARRQGDRVERELERLPERQRVALWLSAVEGRSYTEIAAVLETSEKSVKALVHRGRSTLVARMEVGGAVGDFERRAVEDSDG